MDKLNEFVEKYKDTYINFDSMHGPQCMDLYRQYVEEVLGFNQSKKVSIAYQVWFYHQPELYEKIKKTKDNYPIPGDIVVWFWAYGGTGHIAVAVDGGLGYAVCFSQNDPGGSPCILKKYSYTHFSGRQIVGWLRPRKNVERVDL